MTLKAKNFKAGLMEMVAEYNIDFSYLGFHIDTHFHKSPANKIVVESLELRRGSEVFGIVFKYGNSYQRLSDEVRRWTQLTVNYASYGEWRNDYE